MTKSAIAFAVCGMCAGTIVGCASSSPSALDANGQPTTQASLDPSTQPSNVVVTANDFDRLWDAADEVSRELLFHPDRQDRRAGVFETEPMTSAQWFEPWRREVRTVDDRAESSLATIRRTLSVRITRDDATGQFRAMPSVLVERFARPERRTTSSARYRQVYEADRGGSTLIQRDANGNILPGEYWYVTGNDPALERYVAQRMEAHLQNP